MPARPCKSYPRLLPVRASETEAARIQAQARACGVSVSRYLVRCAVEARPPPTEEERETLRALRFLLEKVSVNLNQIAHRTNRAWLRGDAPPAAEEIAGVVQGVKRLSQELRRRLGKR